MKRIQVLDIFRGVAVILVMLYHYTSMYRILYQHKFPEQYDCKYGYLGVQFFFIISGFVIFMTLGKVKNAADFLYKRFSRLYPTFWLCMLLTAAIVYCKGLPGREISFREFLLNFTMIPKAFNAGPVDGAYWSLLPEFFFYLLMAVLIWSGRLKFVYTWSTAWLVLSFAGNYFEFMPAFLKGLLNTHWGMFFVAGVMFYKLKIEKVKSIFPHVIIVLSLAAYWPFILSHMELVLIILIYVFFYLFAYDKLDRITFKPLLFMGEISFPLYLLHQNIGYVIMNYTKPYFAAMGGLILIPPVIITIVLAFLVSRYFEKNATEFLRKKNVFAHKHVVAAIPQPELK